MKKILHIPLYHTELTVVVKRTLEQNEHSAYVEFENGELWLHIRPGADAGLVAHEAVHIANHVFKECRITPDLDNDEPYAYLIGWIVEQVTKLVHRGLITS